METIANELDEMQTELYVEEVPVSQILANRYQPRTLFEELELAELAESIKQHGVLQPIILRKVTSDMYEIVAGERRYRASKLLGLETVSAIVKDITAPQAAILALIENVQREDLSAIEEAKSYEQLIVLFDKTQNEIADMVGKSQSAVANKLRLLQLSEEVKEAIERKLITERHGRALLKIKDMHEQNQILELAITKNYTVAILEEYIEQFLENKENIAAGKNVTTIFNIAKDTKLAVNTINKAVKTIREFGMDINVEQLEKDENYEFVISIPKKMIEVEKKRPVFAHQAIQSTTEELQKTIIERSKEPEQLSFENPVESKVVSELLKEETTQSLILDLDLTTENVFDQADTTDWSTDELKRIIEQTTKTDN